MANLFNKKVLNRHLQNHSIKNKEEKMDRIKNWKVSLKENKRANETRLQGAFLNAIFSLILGYKGETNTSDGKFTMKAEPTTEVDATKPDGSLGFFKINGQDKTKAVIELKGPDKSLDTKQNRSGKDYGTPVEQAFNYATKHDGCKWVIVSNMIEIRLYKSIRGQGHYEEFLIPELDQEENFNKFTLLLSQDNLINKNEKSLTEKLSEETVTHEDDISTEFYNLYKKTRIELFEHLKENNEDYKSTLLLEKAQKFLDRIIFICFCEDLGLLPPETLHTAIERGKDSYVQNGTEVWMEMRGVFKSIDQGNSDKGINAYNGGLFKPDEILDNLTIKNEFFEDVDKIAAYDFDSELDVNILGHIFEQSINDIEEIKADIKDEDYDEQDSKRKKDGIFYTPEYITKYIVENSIGQYLEDIKEESGYNELPDIESAPTPQEKGKRKKKHFNFYDEYEEKLRNIKVLDPACGSGAFLNQAFDYLLKEHKWIQRQRSLIEEGQMNIYSREGLLKQILQDNIYGVDLNEESVEITKLSLWLKTANKNKPLANLDDNIKCGNSLIDDPKLANDKAFNWNEEFSKIMKEGGFDIVIGNPPWGAKFENEEHEYLLNKHSNIIGDKFNSYLAFLELSINLCQNEKYIGMITPNTYLRRSTFKKTRNWIISNTKIIKIVDLGGGVFEDAVVPSSIIILKNSSKQNKYFFHGISLRQVQNNKYKRKQLQQENLKEIDISTLEKLLHQKFILRPEKINLILKLENKGLSFNKVISDMTKGVQTGKNKVFIVSENIKRKYNIEEEVCKKVLFGRNIKRYQINYQKNHLLSIHRNLKLNNYPNLKKYLHEHKDILEKRDFVKKGKLRWFDTTMYKEPDFFNKDRIIMRRTGDSLIATFDNIYYNVNAVYNIFISEQYKQNLSYKYLLALINSKLINYYYTGLMNEQNRTFAEVHKANLLKMPIILANKKFQSKIIKNVNILLNKYKTLNKKEDIRFSNLINKYTSNTGPTLSEIVKQDGFYNKIYSGRARKVREMTATINDNIITLYADKSSSGKYELMKFEVDDKYQRQYIKLYLENFTEEQLEAANEFSGSLPKKILQIEIPDYNKYNVIRKVVNEWNKLQNEIAELEDKIEETDNEIDQMVYDLYDLTDEEIEIVESSLE